MAPLTSFPFMKLPKEIRLMVYESLPRRISHHKVRINSATKSRFSGVTLIIRSTETSILCVGREIYAEALPIIHRTIKDFILSKAPQMMSCTHEANGHVLETLMGCTAVGFMQLKQELGLNTVLVSRAQGGLRLQTLPAVPGNAHDDHSRMTRLLRATKGDRNRLHELAADMRLNLKHLRRSESHKHVYAAFNTNMKVILLYIAKSIRQLVYRELQQLGHPTIEYVRYYSKQSTYDLYPFRVPSSPWYPYPTPMDSQRVSRMLVIDQMQMLTSHHTAFANLCADSGVLKGMAGTGLRGFEQDPDEVKLFADELHIPEHLPKGVLAALPSMELQTWRENWVEGEK